MTTTAEYREAARKHESDCQWLLAARLYDLAWKVHPGEGALAERDIENLMERANNCRRTAKQERETSEPVFTNYYRCPDCAHEWQDDWPAMCDDECPECRLRAIQPYNSEPNRPPPFENHDLVTFTRATVEALYFTDTGDEGQPAKDAELSPDTLADLKADCRSWWRRFGCFVEAAGMTPEQAGHDFWLTRNGHGAGFEDGDWPEPYADMFDKGAQCYEEFTTYLGDDGLIYATT